MKSWTRTLILVAATAVLGVTGLSAASGTPTDPYAGDQPSAHQPNALQPQTNAPSVVVQSEFVPITPCRIVDTRTAIGKINGGETRSYYVAGTFGFAPQGGHAGGCGIPVGASAVAANLTATQAAGAGYLRAWPAGGSEPTATVLSYTGPGSTGTGATLAIRQTASANLTVKNYGSATHLIVDVFGYYREPMAASVGSSGTLGYHSNHVLSSAKSLTGSYSVNFDRNISGCVLVATAEQSYYNVGGYTSGNNAIIYTRDVTFANSPYADAAFTLTVTC